MKFLIPSKAQWKRATPFTRLAYFVGWIAIITFIIKIIMLLTPSFQKHETEADSLKHKEPIEENKTVIIKNKSYQLKGFYNKNFTKKIKNKINIDNTSINFIEITYSGKILQLHESQETYIYNGGHLVVKTNSDCFLKFNELKISALRPNSKDFILSEIKTHISIHLNSNLDYICKEIIQCL